MKFVKKEVTMKTEIKLSDHFNYNKLLRFTLPSVVMMIFTSVYGVVDGLFVSNYAGKTAFVALNFIMPFLMILGTFGFMFGAGGSALIAKTLGEGDENRANRIFSLLIYVTIVVGIITSAVSLVIIRPVAELLGAEGQMLEDSVLYSRVILCALPALMLQFEFHSFFITAGKPKLGLAITLMSGVTNMVLDALLTAVFPLGLLGAAIATALSQAVGGLVPLIYFSGKNSSTLRLGKTNIDWRVLLKTATNGSSELMSNISMNVVSMLYNVQLLKYAGEDGISAYGILMYVNFVFISAFIGYSVGVAPVIGYHYGSQNHGELKNLKKKSFLVIIGSSIVMFLLAEVFASPISGVFVGYDRALCEMTVRAFRINAFSFLFSGFAIFSSSFFTALNDGLTSALISFLRTLVFNTCTVLIFPLIWGLNGIWFSIVAAEIMAVIISLLFLATKKKKYNY